MSICGREEKIGHFKKCVSKCRGKQRTAGLSERYFIEFNILVYIASLCILLDPRIYPQHCLSQILLKWVFWVRIPCRKDGYPPALSQAAFCVISTPPEDVLGWSIPRNWQEILSVYITFLSQTGRPTHCP